MGSDSRSFDHLGVQGRIVVFAGEIGVRGRCGATLSSLPLLDGERGEELFDFLLELVAVDYHADACGSAG